MTIIAIGLLLLFYHILLFPALLLGMAKRRTESAPVETLEDEQLPSIDMFISAKNEESCLGAKLDNSLKLDYPADRLTITVLANGCNDRTADIVRDYEDRGIVLSVEGEIGKTEAQNRAVELSNAEIIVFSDANTLYDQEALRHLMQPFTDPTVGSVSGRHFYEDSGNATDATEGAMWNSLETMLKRAESDTGGMIGANGSIYSVRREFYIPLPSDVISDFIEPLLIAAHGHRTVYAEKAVARETAEKNLRLELERKQRIVRRSVASLMKYPELLSPTKSGRIAWLLWSRKVLRWAAPFLLVIIVGVSLLRIIFGRGQRLDYVLFGGSSLFAFLALLGRGLGTEKAIPGLTHAYYITLLIRAAILGVYRAIVAGSQLTWDHSR